LDVRQFQLAEEGFEVGVCTGLMQTGSSSLPRQQGKVTRRCPRKYEVFIFLEFLGALLVSCPP